MSKWKVTFMDRLMQPPYPFGKRTVEVEASNKKEAIEKVKLTHTVSDRYPIKASKIRTPKCKYCKGELTIRCDELQCQKCNRFQT